MAEWTPTPPQAAAIAARGGNVLCAAAAGAGKTAVLAERVVGLLADAREPLQVDQLLVVTYTRAAAAEMRRRIAQRLRQRAGEAGAEHLQRQLWLLPQADISTIHGFCERALRRHFAVAGLDPAFLILDPAEADLLLEQCLDELLEARYAGRDGPAFADTLERYGGRRLDESLRALALRLHAYALSMEDPAAWLERQGVEAQTPEYGTARAAAQRVLRQALGQIRRAADLAGRPDGPTPYLAALAADEELLQGLLVAADGEWDGFAAGLRAAAFVTLRGRGDADPLLAERAQALRSEVKTAVRALAQGPFGRSAADHAAETALVAAQLRPLLDLVAELRTAYAGSKRRLHSLDFSDLEHGALALLRGPAGPALAGRYREVLVDEAQDLSPVQDALLSALCGPAALFCVGDARQSIYGFRLAEPRRFLQRAEDYSAGGRGRRIELPHNFRSRRSILSGVNHLFDRLFGARGSDLPREEAGPLLYGSDYAGEDPPLQLCLLEGQLEDAEDTALEREAQAVAALVAGWLETAGRRPGDAAILLRAMANAAAAYVAAIRALGLPCWAPSGGSRAASAEGRTLLAWLQVLDNPQQDIPLAATLHGPFGGFSDADLARLRLGGPGSLWGCLRAAGDAGAQAWLARLDGWRTQARRGAFGQLVAAAVEESGYAAAVAALPGGAQRQANLAWIEQRCRQAERLGVSDLPRLIDLLQRGESGETVAEAAAAAGDAVRVLSIHGSKGLEFPCVVVAGLGRGFQLRERSGDVLAHREAGLGARAVDLERRRKWPTLRHAAVAERIEADARAEELRVLYVGLTRARERLALVGTVRGLPEQAAAWASAAGAEADLGAGACPLDWIMPALAEDPGVARALAALREEPGEAPPPAPGAPPAHRFEVLLHPGRPVPAGAEAPAAPAQPPERAQGPPPGAAEPGLAARLDAEHAWRYPFAALLPLAAKATVGEMGARWAASEDEEPGMPLERDARPLPPLARPRLIRGGQAPTPTEAGTAAHLVLRHLDLAGPCDGRAVRDCASGLVARQRLEPALAGAVDAEALGRFLRGALGLRLRAAAAQGRLRREVPFTQRLLAATVHRMEGLDGEWVLVQGVIDALIVEPEALVVVDYKTDRAAGPAAVAEAAAHHRPQVELYAQAAQWAWNRPVREGWVAFLTAGADLEVLGAGRGAAG